MLKTSAAAAVWQHRSLLLALTTRDIQNRYAGSVAGGLWALVHPLLMLAMYALVFTYVFRVQVPTASASQPYVLFVAVALWPWLAFQEAVMRGTTAVQAHAALVKKVAFPHELLVYSSVASCFAIHMVGYFLVLLTLRLMGYGVSLWSFPVLLLAAGMLAALAALLSMFLGALQVFIKDVEQILAQFLSVLFYATPILYPMTLVPAWLGDVMQWNPLVPLTEMMRQAVLLGGSPSINMVGMLTGSIFVAFYLARRFFLRLSPYFEDMV